MPNGDKIMHLKVGGRTSAIVPAVQKKTAAVAGDLDESEANVGSSPKRKASKIEEDANGGAELVAETESMPKKSRQTHTTKSTKKEDTNKKQALDGNGRRSSRRSLRS